MEGFKILYTTTADAKGGRDGRTETRNGTVAHDLSKPKDMGGAARPGATTPEDLFAAGYAGCFGSACEHVAKTMLELSPTSVTVSCEVSLGAEPSGALGLRAKLSVTTGGLSTDDARAMVEKAHTVCPYSRAVRGNVPVELHVEAA